MSEGLELNSIIQETIFNNCENDNTLSLIIDCLQYELNIWNRQISPNEIIDKYNYFLEKMIRE